MAESNKFEDIKNQINIIKAKLENIDKTLSIQEKTLDLIQENSRSLFREAIPHEKETNLEEIMKSVFKGNKLPRILFK